MNVWNGIFLEKLNIPFYSKFGRMINSKLKVLLFSETKECQSFYLLYSIPHILLKFKWNINKSFLPSALQRKRKIFCCAIIIWNNRLYNYAINKAGIMPHNSTLQFSVSTNNNQHETWNIETRNKQLCHMSQFGLLQRLEV